MDRRLLLVGTALVAIALFARGSALQSRSQSALGDEIVQPATWIPFQADVLITTPGVQDVHGRFFRAADGSGRLETGTQAEPDKLVWINNLTQGVTYRRRDGVWSFSPLPLPEGGLHPGLYRYRTGMNGLVEMSSAVFVDHQSQLLSPETMGAAPTPEHVQAFQAFRYVNPRGNTRVVVPSLNFFAILRQDLATGRREVYFNVDPSRHPEPALFQPPLGAVVGSMAIQDMTGAPAEGTAGNMMK